MDIVQVDEELELSELPPPGVLDLDIVYDTYNPLAL